MYAVLLIFGILLLPGPSCTNSDNLALLTDTLRTTQRAACDDEMVSLACPTGTSIYIQVAQYGKLVTGGHACAGGVANIEVLDGEKCTWPNPMQYSLLQRVVEECQKKPQCTFSTKSKPDMVDPCPRARKFVEVAYKCRPSEFWTRTGCEDEVIKLSCNIHSRLVILDAKFGRLLKEAVACPQPKGVADETCLARYAAKTVMRMCHGRMSCQIVANNRTFGSPCSPNSRSYLKVVYACVPLGVLKERYENAAGDDKKVGYDAKRDGGLYGTSDPGEKWREVNLFPPAASSQSSIEDFNIPSAINKEHDSIHIIVPNVLNDEESSIIKGSSHYSSNTKFVIYIGIGILVIIILVALILGIQYYRNRKRASNSKNGDMFTTEAPNIFSDTASDLDNDVDVSHISGTFYDPLHPDMILYRDGQTKTALRAMKPLSTVYPTSGVSMYGNVDYVPSHSRDIGFATKEREGVLMSPKSLAGFNNSQFFYG